MTVALFLSILSAALLLTGHYDNTREINAESTMNYYVFHYLRESKTLYRSPMDCAACKVAA